MRVIHIIPSAFDYFNDIRSRAFALMEELHKLGVENEAVTLQYGQLDRATKKSVRQAAPAAAHNYLGDFDINSVIKSFANFDLVHLHCPFFGAAGKILKWRKNESHPPLVCTYYRPAHFEDMISLFIKFYNAHYLPKIFALADKVIFLAELPKKTDVASHTAMVYNSLVNDES